MSAQEYADLMDGKYELYADMIAKPDVGPQLEVCSMYNGGGNVECPEAH